jgi:hypothetical protein
MPKLKFQGLTMKLGVKLSDHLHINHTLRETSYFGWMGENGSVDNWGTIPMNIMLLCHMIWTVNICRYLQLSVYWIRMTQLLYSVFPRKMQLILYCPPFLLTIIICSLHTAKYNYTIILGNYTVTQTPLPLRKKIQTRSSGETDDVPKQNIKILTTF